MLELIPYRKQDLPAIKHLYMTAFPDEERAPWWLLKRRAMQKRADFFTALDDGAFAGIAYVVQHKDMVYLFYLAVEENQRGKGTGGKILSALHERFPGKRIFLAREQLDKSAENYPQRESRHRFYLANGFEDWQLRIKEGPVTYDVMGIGSKVSSSEYHELISSWTGSLVGMFFRAKLIE